MLSRLLQLLMHDTALAVEHAAAYAELAVAESRAAAYVLRRRVLLKVLAASLAFLGLVATVVALLLVAALPLAQMPIPWLLGVLPLVPFALAAAVMVYSRGLQARDPFGELRRQVALDIELFNDSARESQS